jgi:hypothetical protein
VTIITEKLQLGLYIFRCKQLDAAVKVIKTLMPTHVVFDWLTFLLRIREAVGSNLGPEIGYRDRFFMVFFCPSRQILR